MSFIETKEVCWGIELICRSLQVAPASHDAAVNSSPPARAVRDVSLNEVITRVWLEHRGGYAANKIWAQLRRERISVARCTVERLMRALGLRGVARERTGIRTTSGHTAAARPADLVQLQFYALVPDRLCGADLTYVETHSG